MKANRSFKKHFGFTLIELIVVMSIMATLIGLVTINLVHVQQRANLNTIVPTFIADMRQQQIKAMIGDTEGRTGPTEPPPYGIHIDSNQYVLFHGAYLVGEPTNSPVNLPQNFQFETPVPDIIFAKIKGEIPADITVKIIDTTNNDKKTIQVNIYGVITSVN